MSIHEHARKVEQFTARVQARLGVIAALEGSVAGFIFAGVVVILLRSLHAPPLATMAAGALVASGVVAANIFIATARNTPGFVALLVQQRTAGSRNILITAIELLAGSADARPFIRERILSDASAAVVRIDPRALFPLRGTLLAALLTGAIWIALSLALPGEGVARMAGANGPGIPSLLRLDIEITAPRYAGGGTVRLRDPLRVDARAGSAIVLHVASAATDSVRLETVSGVGALRRDGPGAFVGELTADADGFIALEPVGQGGSTGARRLIGLAVTPDAAPRVRISVPGRDLFLASGDSTIALLVEADDDIALSSLALRFTRVSGSGEQFTFAEGAIPAAVDTLDARQWSGRAAWDLRGLGLAAGDMLVYRALAADVRPGAPQSESDSFIIEIVGPGALLAGGFSIDEERDRYGISQQMVILMTERLLARRDSISAAEFADEARGLASAQRQVRSEFVFMMGGELAEEIEQALTGLGDLDEHSHAAADEDAAAGRLGSQGREDLIRAVRAMSQAAATLAVPDLTGALEAEKTALTFLQRAFSRTRYILRTLTERERLDAGRRLTGTLAAAVGDKRASANPSADSVVIKMRSALAGIATVAASRDEPSMRAATVTRLAQDILGANPSDEKLRVVSDSLLSAAGLLGAGLHVSAASALESAALALAGAIRASIPVTAAPAISMEGRTLQGSLVDALRGGPVRAPR